MRQLRAEAVLAWRMHRQHLVRRAPPAGLLRVTADIAGAHAQLMSSAELTLWARIDSLASDAVERALWHERTLVKTWAMRGTLHLLPAVELPLWVAAQRVLKPRHHTPSWLRYFGLTREQADALLAAIPEALDGRMLTRDELAGAVGELTGSRELGDKLRKSWGALLKPAAFQGLLCFAPSAGRNVRFVRPQEWLPEWHEPAPEEAAREVVRRYLAAYGPASRERFARWFGIPSAAQAGRLIAALGDEVEAIALDGAPGWALAADIDEMAAAEPSDIVRLLPAFDQYVVGAPRDDETVLPRAYKAQVYRPQGWLSPVVVCDGRITGTWSHEGHGDGLEIRVEPFGDPTPAERAGVEAEAARLAAFLGARPVLDWT